MNTSNIALNTSAVHKKRFKRRKRILTKDLATNLILIIFILRPIIDLPYDDSIIMGMNLAGLVAIATIFLGILWFVKHHKIQVIKQEYWLFAYLFIALFSTIIHMSSFSDFAYVIRMTSSIVFLFCVAPSINKRVLINVYKLYIFISLIPIIISFLQVIHLFPFTYFDHSMGRAIGRASGGYRHPSSLVRVVMFSMIYDFYLIETDWRDGKKRKIAYAYLAIAIASIIISYLRSGYFTLGIIVLLWYALKYKGNLGKLIFRVLIIAAIVVIAFVFVYRRGLLQVDLKEFSKFFSINNIINEGAGTASGFYLRGRSEFVERLITAINTSPLHVVLFGNGVDVSNYNGINMAVADMHFIRIIWNCGFIGLIIWCVYIFGFFMDVWRKRNKTPDPLIIYTAICVFVFYFLWGITKEPTTQPNFMSHLFLTCGFVCHNREIKNEVKLYHGYRKRSKKR